MLNEKVINSLTWVYSLFDIKLLTVMAAGLTIYFGLQKITKKVSVYYVTSSDEFCSDYISTLVLTNRRDNTIVITETGMEFVGRGGCSIIKHSPPIALKPYDSHTIELEPHSSIYDCKEKKHSEMEGFIRFYLIDTAGKKHHCTTECPIHEFGFPRYHIYRSYVGDILLTNKIAFIFQYKIRENHYCCAISKRGIVSENNPFGSFSFQGNANDILALRGALISEGLHEKFDNYAFYQLDEQLELVKIYNKKNVSDYKRRHGQYF